jgi:alpha-glucosidase
VEAQSGQNGSTLEIYRELLRMRRELVCAEELVWVKHWFNKNVLHFKRPNGWQSITNFGDRPAKLPKGRLLATSQPLVDGKLGPNTTAWLK